jgi:hypothetical protein
MFRSYVCLAINDADARRPAAGNGTGTIASSRKA